MKKLETSILLCLCFLLCGCTGYREIDRGYFVTAIAFSVKNENSTVFIEALSSSDVIEGQSKRVVLEGNGNNTQEAFKNLKSHLVKPLYFEHLGAAIFEGKADEGIDFLKEITDISYGIYLVKTDDINPLLESETPNGVLGYDIIALIKNSDKKNDARRLYNTSKNKKELPVVNLVDGNLVLKLGD